MRSFYASHPWVIGVVILFGFVFLAALRAILLNKIFGRNKSYQPKSIGFHQKYPPTGKQIDYFKKLVDENNSFRAKEKTVEDWYWKSLKGSVTFKGISNLIEFLKSENQKLQSRFSDDQQNIKPDQSKYVYPSDLSTMNYCEHAVYLKYQGHVNKNYYELHKGTAYHSKNDSEPKTKAKISVNYFQKINPNIKRIAWGDQNDGLVYSKHSDLAGKCDGFAYFNNQTKSIIELKSKSDLSETSHPYDGHIIQTASYHLIYGETHQLNDHFYIVYKDTEYRGRDPLIFEMNFQNYRVRTLKNYERLYDIKNKGIIPPKTENLNKCKACGYRSQCRNIF